MRSHLRFLVPAGLVFGLLTCSHDGYLRLRADESTPVVEQLPAPLSASAPQKQKDERPVVAIKSQVPSYLDRGVTMVPLRPVADYLNIAVSLHDGVLTLTQRKPSGIPLVATVRLNGRTAQLVSDTGTRTYRMPLPPEARIGNTFVPLRFLMDALNVSAGFRVPDNAIVLQTPESVGILTPSNPPEYQHKSAATVTITNNIGRALSLRLNGPQKISLELGRGQGFTRKVAPGVYYYRAVCAGMRPRTGARRLHAGGKVAWAWGKG